MRTGPIAGLLPLFIGQLIWMIPSLATPATAHADTVLLIGDSHSTGAFGEELDRLLREFLGRRVGEPRLATYASCGSSPSWWIRGIETRCGYFERAASGESRRSKNAPTPILSGLLSDARPSYTIVQQGTNLLGSTRAEILEEVTALAKVIASKQSICIWIGPPDIRYKADRLDELYEAIEVATAENRCVLLDSRRFADVKYPDRGGDGIHFDSLGTGGVRIARSWARQINDMLEVLIEESRAQRVR